MKDKGFTFLEIIIALTLSVCIVVTVRQSVMTCFFSIKNCFFTTFAMAQLQNIVRLKCIRNTYEQRNIEELLRKTIPALQVLTIHRANKLNIVLKWKGEKRNRLSVQMPESCV